MAKQTKDGSISVVGKLVTVAFIDLKDHGIIERGLLGLHDGS